MAQGEASMIYIIVGSFGMIASRLGLRVEY